jgi:lipoprotein-releasing system ATP-binding protein
MAPAAALLKLIDISKRFDAVPPSLAASARPQVGPRRNAAEAGQNAEHLQVLRGISLEMARGESLAIIGPSGSGKSTVLNIIGTLDRPTSGQVVLEGQDLSQLDDTELAAVRNQQIGFVFQSHYLLPQCTVLENVLVPTLASPPSLGASARPQVGPRRNAVEAGKATSRNGAEERAQQLLERVGLGQRLAHRPGQLSGGERQRVAVVRALINQPKLLLADEPTGALDRAAAQDLGQLLVDLNREQGVTLIVVTHALELARRMGRVLELRDGMLTAYAE